MQAKPSREPPGPPLPVITPEPIRPARGPLAKLLSNLRGDKYMAGAYPPEWKER
jgi:hypothetical protein